jgi:hypothetical protein
MVYDRKYVEIYNTYETNDAMSEMRLGFCKRYAFFESVLDVGYGNGSFLKICLEDGLTCHGHDISGYPIPDGAMFTDDRNTPVDLVTFFDCIEHFARPDIDTVLSDLRCKYLCISIPWCHYTDDMESFEIWKHRKPNEHFHHMDVRGMTTLLNKAGYDLMSVSSFEDVIRSNRGGLPNILTVMSVKHDVE